MSHTSLSENQHILRILPIFKHTRTGILSNMILPSDGSLHGTISLVEPIILAIKRSKPSGPPFITWPPTVDMTARISAYYPPRKNWYVVARAYDRTPFSSFRGAAGIYNRSS